MPTETAGVLHSPTALGEPFRPAFEGPQACAVLREASTLDELAASFVDHRAGDRRFVGIDPDQDLHERRHLRFGRTSAISTRRTFRLRAVHIPLLSHSARRVLYGGTRAENKPTHLVGDRKFRSDPCITGALEA